ncbi:MAG: hypothetical protein ACP5G1_02245 [Nanopusillaceae archaeon]
MKKLEKNINIQMKANEIIEKIENDIRKVDYIVFDISNLNVVEFKKLLNYLESKMYTLIFAFDIERYDKKVYLIVTKL